jgi:hypothetical protein
LVVKHFRHVRNPFTTLKFLTYFAQNANHMYSPRELLEPHGCRQMYQAERVLHRVRSSPCLSRRLHTRIPSSNYLATENYNKHKSHHQHGVSSGSLVSQFPKLEKSRVTSQCNNRSLLRMDCLIQILDYDESNFTESAWIGVLFQILENCCGIICSCAPMLSTYGSKLGHTTVATSLRRFITTNISRISHGSGGSANSRRSVRAGSVKLENQTIGSWRVNQIKKESSFGVTTYEGENEGESQEHLAESSQHNIQPRGGIVAIEMNNFPQTNSRMGA